jgi:hypothetical protein
MQYIYVDFILLIFNCEKYKYKAQKQKETWLKEQIINMPYFHVIGKPNLTTEYVFDNKDKILYVQCLDDYVSLPQKAILAYSAINKEYIYKYIFKTDDDQNLIDYNFFNKIITHLQNNPNIHYGGYIVNIKKDHFSNYHKVHPELPPNIPLFKTQYCSGRFYLLSTLAVEALVLTKDKITKEYFEDYAIGYYLPDFLKKNILNIQTNNYLVDFTFL